MGDGEWLEYFPNARACLFKLPTHLRDHYGIQGHLYVPPNFRIPSYREEADGDVRWLDGRKAALQCYNGYRSEESLDEDARYWLGHYLPFEYPEFWDPYLDEREHIQWKFESKGLRMPRVTEIRRALVEAIEDDLLEWDDELEQPWLDREFPAPRRQKSTQTAPTTSAPAGRVHSSVGSALATAVREYNTGASKPKPVLPEPAKQSTTITPVPASRAHSTIISAVAAAVREYDVGASKLKPAPPKSMKQPPPSSNPAEIQTPAKQIVVAAPAIPENSHPAAPKPGSSASTTLQAKSKDPEQKKVVGTPRAPDPPKSSTVTNATLKLSPSSANLLAKSISESIKPPITKAEVPFDLLSFDELDTLDSFSVLKPQSATKKPPTAATILVPTPVAPPIPWASKPKPMPIIEEELRPSIVNTAPQQPILIEKITTESNTTKLIPNNPPAATKPSNATQTPQPTVKKTQPNPVEAPKAQENVPPIQRQKLYGLASSRWAD